MAGGMDLGSGGKGKKRALDTAINLVPFIDLMAVTISFLIMTAVWNQVGRLQVSQAGGVSDADKPPPEATLPITLTVSERGFTVSAGGAAVDVPKVAGAYVYCRPGSPERVDGICEEKTLVGLLRKLKADAPTQRAITVQVEDGVRNGDFVKVLDVCNLRDASGQPELFPDVSVSGVG